MRDRHLDPQAPDEAWNDRRWEGASQPPADRGRMYEQSTQMSGYGQQGWQGGYTQPGPGQGGQQQDYRQQQGYGQGGHAPLDRTAPGARAPDMGPFRGRGPKGYTRSDERILDDVNDRLTDDAWIDASDIEVGVTNGVVTLEGTVPDRNQKRRAEDVAADCSGVHDVANRLRVRRPTEDILDAIGDALTGSKDG